MMLHVGMYQQMRGISQAPYQGDNVDNTASANCPCVCRVFLWQTGCLPRRPTCAHALLVLPAGVCVTRRGSLDVQRCHGTALAADAAWKPSDNDNHHGGVKTDSKAPLSCFSVYP